MDLDIITCDRSQSLVDYSSSMVDELPSCLSFLYQHACSKGTVIGLSVCLSVCPWMKALLKA